MKTSNYLTIGTLATSLMFAGCFKKQNPQPVIIPAPIVHVTIQSPTQPQQPQVNTDSIYEAGKRHVLDSIAQDEAAEQPQRETRAAFPEGEIFFDRSNMPHRYNGMRPGTEIMIFTGSRGSLMEFSYSDFESCGWSRMNRQMDMYEYSMWSQPYRIDDGLRMTTQPSRPQRAYENAQRNFRNKRY